MRQKHCRGLRLILWWDDSLRTHKQFRQGLQFPFQWKCETTRWKYNPDMELTGGVGLSVVSLIRDFIGRVNGVVVNLETTTVPGQP